MKPVRILLADDHEVVRRGVRAILENQPKWTVCGEARTVHESEQIVTEGIDAGAHGYVLKADAGRTSVEAVRALLGHREFFSERVHAVVVGRTKPRRPARASRRPGRLSPREREVLQLLTEGKSNKEGGTVLGMTTKTAETHRAHLMAKLNLHSMSELLRYAIRNRIIEP